MRVRFHFLRSFDYLKSEPWPSYWRPQKRSRSNALILEVNFEVDTITASHSRPWRWLSQTRSFVRPPDWPYFGWFDWTRFDRLSLRQASPSHRKCFFTGSKSAAKLSLSLRSPMSYCASGCLRQIAYLISIGGGCSRWADCPALE